MLDGAGEPGGVAAVKREAASASGGFTEGAVRGTDAGFTIGKAFEHGQAETLHERGVNREDTGTIGGLDGGVGGGTVVAHRPAGGLEYAQPLERRASRLRMGHADQAQLKAQTTAPERLAGVEQRDMVFAPLEEPMLRMTGAASGALVWP